MRAAAVVLMLSLPAAWAAAGTAPPPPAAEAPPGPPALWPGPAPSAGPDAASLPARPAPRAGETTFSAQVGAFTWKEFDDDGRRLVKESGPLFGLNLDYQQFGRRFGGRVGAGVFGGEVDYDGQTQGGEPAATRTLYLGLEGEGDLRARFAPAPRVTLEPFAGLGGRVWDRDIQNRGELEGYSEIWMLLYGRAGLSAAYDFAPRWRAFAQGGWRLPIYTVQDVDLSGFGVGTVTLHPRQQPAPFVEAGCRWKLLFVSFFYEALRFDKSDVVSLAAVEQGRPATLTTWQPESRADLYGLRVGLSGAF